MPTLFCYGIRSLIAFLLYAVFFGKRILKNIKKEHIVPCLTIAGAMTFSMLSANISLKYADPSTAGFLLSIAVIFSPFFSFIFLKRKPAGRIFFPILLTVAGLYFLCGGGLKFTMGFGEIMGILCSATYAMVMVLSEKHLNVIDVVIVSAFQTGVGAVISLLLGVITDDITLLAELPASNWYTVVFLAVFCTFAAFYFQNFALSHLSSTFASILFSTESVFTAVCAYFILDDTMNRFEFIGSALVLIGVVTASLSGKNSHASDS